MRERWQSDWDESIARDRESWRGDVHPDNADSWRRGAPDDAACDTGERAEEAWRDSVHLTEWPEESAGPEYWMYKRMSEGV